MSVPTYMDKNKFIMANTSPPAQDSTQKHCRNNWWALTKIHTVATG